MVQKKRENMVQKKRENMVQKKRGGSNELSPEVIRVCKTLDMFLRQSSEVGKHNRSLLMEILSNCDKTTKEDCVVTNYIKSDDWHHFTDKMRGLRFGKGDFMGEMRRKKSILNEQTENLEVEIEKLQNQVIINKYLSQNIFSDSLLVDGNEQAVFENMINNLSENRFKTDCEMCNDKNYWQSVLDEMKELGEEAFDRKIYTTYCDYCSNYAETPVTSFEQCERLRALNFAYDCKDKMNGEMKDKFSDEDHANLKKYIDWILSKEFKTEENEPKQLELKTYMEDKGIKFN